MNRYSKRLNAVIPGGAHTYSRGDDQYPSNAPAMLARGAGAYVWDSDSGRRFLDYGMALRAVTLGYAHERVNAAAWEQIQNGVNLTRPSTVELEAAELMVDLIPGAEMVKFAKNGSNVTTAAAKIARAYTARKYICIPREHPFFSFDDWFIGTTALKRGIPPEHHSTTLLFSYGDVASLDALFDRHPGEIAAVMMEPATAVTPCPPDCTRELSLAETCASCPETPRNFLRAARGLCDRHGALLILDEMITGFRWHLRGAQTFFGVDPDLSTFGKGMANGFALAALVGKREFMEVGSIDKPGTERTFLLSTTHGAEMPALGAFIGALSVYRETDAIAHFWSYGAKLKEAANSISRSLGLERHFCIEGLPPALNYVARDAAGEVSLGFRTLFVQEMVRHGVLMPWIAVSLAHEENELQHTLDAMEATLTVYRKAVNGRLDDYLDGPAIKPVFRQFN